MKASNPIVMIEAYACVGGCSKTEKIIFASRGYRSSEGFRRKIKSAIGIGALLEMELGYHYGFTYREPELKFRWLKNCKRYERREELQKPIWEIYD